MRGNVLNAKPLIEGFFCALFTNIAPPSRFFSTLHVVVLASIVVQLWRKDLLDLMRKESVPHEYVHG
jgi:hypothetical protein